MRTTRWCLAGLAAFQCAAFQCPHTHRPLVTRLRSAVTTETTAAVEEAAVFLPEEGRDVKTAPATLVAQILADVKAEEMLPAEMLPMISRFIETYIGVVQSDLGRDPESAVPVLKQYVELVEAQIREPFQFDPYHKAVYAPVDHYDMDTAFMEPLIDLEDSVLLGAEHFATMKAQLDRGENVVFLSNHQTEADPSAWSAIMDRGAGQAQEGASNFVRDLIMVAGDRVTTDPVAVPFSKARNLLCIYSKRHIDNPPSQKRKKQMHNMNTMGEMLKLLGLGGSAIWVAPSGGRDRPNDDGDFDTPAKFDPKSVDMFRLMASKVSLLKKTHFWPMAMLTHRLFPPPPKVGTDLGEPRIAMRGSVNICFRPELDFSNAQNLLQFADGTTDLDEKDAARVQAANYAYAECDAAYQALLHDATARGSPYYP